MLWLNETGKSMSGTVFVIDSYIIDISEPKMILFRSLGATVITNCYFFGGGGDCNLGVSQVPELWDSFYPETLIFHCTNQIII